jgi:hypothetical protein
VYDGIHGDELILILMAGSKRTQTVDPLKPTRRDEGLQLFSEPKFSTMMNVGGCCAHAQ